MKIYIKQNYLIFFNSISQLNIPSSLDHVTLDSSNTYWQTLDLTWEYAVSGTGILHLETLSTVSQRLGSVLAHPCKLPLAQEGRDLFLVIAISPVVRNSAWYSFEWQPNSSNCVRSSAKRLVRPVFYLRSLQSCREKDKDVNNITNYNIIQ